MKPRHLMMIIGILLGQTAMAVCAINPNIPNTANADAAVANTENVSLQNAYVNDKCRITKGWHPGGTLPAGVPAGTLHITVTKPNGAKRTCHVFPVLNGSGENVTTCR